MAPTPASAAAVARNCITGYRSISAVLPYDYAPFLPVAPHRRGSAITTNLTKRKAPGNGRRALCKKS
jgi:hypothetical protein